MDKDLLVQKFHAKLISIFHKNIIMTFIDS
jgi:hypothetical protein